MVKLSRRRRKPGEVATRKQAIRNMCLECMGYQIAEVHKCTSEQCWLWPYRLGAKDSTENVEEVKDGQTNSDGEVGEEGLRSEPTEGSN